MGKDGEKIFQKSHKPGHPVFIFCVMELSEQFREILYYNFYLYLTNKSFFNHKVKIAMTSVSQNAFLVRCVSFFLNLFRLCSYTTKIPQFSEIGSKRWTIFNGEIHRYRSKFGSLTLKNVFFGVNSFTKIPTKRS
jgi:hypothetical protein